MCQLTCETGRHDKATDFWIQLAESFKEFLTRTHSSAWSILDCASVQLIDPAFAGFLFLFLFSVLLFCSENHTSLAYAGAKAVGRGRRSSLVLEARKSDVSSHNAVSFSRCRTSGATLWSLVQITVSHGL